MNNPAPELDEIAGAFASLLSLADVQGLADDALLETTGALERLDRRLGAMLGG